MKCLESMRGLARAGLAALALSLLTAACGGGTDRVDPFVPEKIVAFGDESSVIEADGRKYTINGMSTTTATERDCTINPIWVQYLAASFDMSFEQCPGTRTTFRAVSQAAVGAKSADVAVAVQSYIAGNTIGSKDLFTVYAGMNDVIATYEDSSISDKVGAVQAAADVLAEQINALARTGGRVLFVVIPDAGLTPYAIAKKTTNADAVTTLSTLSERFNTQLYVKVINDGHAIGLVSAEELSQVIVKLPAYHGYTNVTEAACDATLVTLPSCDAEEADLVAGADASKGGAYLWASDRHFSASTHARLGSVAFSRAKNNPF